MTEPPERVLRTILVEKNPPFALRLTVLIAQQISSSHRAYSDARMPPMSALLSWRNTQYHHLVIYIILIVIVSYNG